MKPDWFTVSDLGDGVHLISESLSRLDPRLAMPTINAHLIVGEKRALLFDTGTGLGDIWARVRRLTRGPVTVVNSHAHWDHVGGNVDFPDIRIHPAEAEDLLRPRLPIMLPGMAQLRPRRPKELVSDGAVIDLGGRSLRVVHTPGHSPGSISLFEEERGLLFTGDAAVSGAIPLGGVDADPAAALDSLRRLAGLAGGLTGVMPGHGPSPCPPSLLETLIRALEGAFAALERGEEGQPMRVEERLVGRCFVVEGVEVILPPGGSR